MNFYLILLMEICPKYCQPDGHSAYFTRINNQGVEDSNSLSSHLLQDGFIWCVICRWKRWNYNFNVQYNALLPIQ
jgi:hypothetical protein